MSSNSFKLNVQTVQSNLPNNSTKSYYKLVNSGIADLNRIIDEIMAVNPGLERERDSRSSIEVRAENNH